MFVQKKFENCGTKDSIDEFVFRAETPAFGGIGTPTSVPLLIDGDSEFIVPGCGSQVTVYLDAIVKIKSPLKPVFLALDQSNNLLAFDRNLNNLSARPIVGLLDNQTAVGVDFRTDVAGISYFLFANGSSSSQIYSLDISNKDFVLATPIGIPLAPIVASSFGFGYNPIADRFRLVTNTKLNFRINQFTGTIIQDANLVYAVGDINQGVTPIVGGVAYTNNDASSLSTTLYDIDSATNSLVIQNPPNNGVLNTVGPLGLVVTDIIGFVIDAIVLPNGTIMNVGFATLKVNGITGLYQINLSSGAATLIKRFDTNLSLTSLTLIPNRQTSVRFNIVINGVNSGISRTFPIVDGKTTIEKFGRTFCFNAGDRISITTSQTDGPTPFLPALTALSFEFVYPVIVDPCKLCKQY